MITSLDEYSAIAAARRAEKSAKPHFTLTPEQTRDREIDRTRLHIVVRMIVNIARPMPLVSKRLVRKRVIENTRLGQTPEEREAMFERAWRRAADTSARMYIDDIDDPDHYAGLRANNGPQTVRRSVRVRRCRRAV